MRFSLISLLLISYTITIGVTVYQIFEVESGAIPSSFVVTLNYVGCCLEIFVLVIMSYIFVSLIIFYTVTKRNKLRELNQDFGFQFKFVITWSLILMGLNIYHGIIRSIFGMLQFAPFAIVYENSIIIQRYGVVPVIDLMTGISLLFLFK